MVAECVASSDGIMALRTQSSRLVRGYILNLCRRRNFRAAGVTERCVKRNISTAIGAFRHPFYLLDVFFALQYFSVQRAYFLYAFNFLALRINFMMLIVCLPDLNVKLGNLLFLFGNDTIQPCNISEIFTCCATPCPAPESFSPIFSKIDILFPPIFSLFQ